MTPWCPFAEQVRAPRDGGSFVAGPFRGVLHTTESMRYTPSTAGYYGHQNWPHFTAWIDADGKPRLAQHIGIDRAARAMENDAGGAQTNRHSAVQLEIAWTAQQADVMPRPLLDLIARFMRWAEAETGIERNVPEFWPYPRSYGATSLRFTAAEWAGFNGWCGHQHVPENAHGDPGDIDIAYLLGEHEEDDMAVTLVRKKGTAPVFQVVDAQTLKHVVSAGVGAVLAGPDWRNKVLDLPADHDLFTDPRIKRIGG